MAVDRRDPELAAPERETLRQFLDFHRDTLLLKVDGLDSAQLRRTVGASTLTLGGLLKHLALVQDGWLVRTMQGSPLPPPWDAIDWDLDPDWDLRSAADDTAEQLLAQFRESCDRARAIEATYDSLDARSARPSRQTGEPFTLRWILCHLIEETARHNGHADLIRESIDGAVGE
jgi:uncharacterized damage-inducible protein DinB